MGIESLGDARRRTAAPVNAQIVPCRRTNSGRRRAAVRLTPPRPRPCRPFGERSGRAGPQ